MRRVVVVLAGLVLVSAAFLVARQLMTGHGADAPDQRSMASVRCRDVERPYGVRLLPRSAAHDLDRSHELHPGDLGVPNVSQARAVDALRTSSTPYEVCAVKGSSRVILVRRQRAPLDRCYGPPSACPRTRYVWLTCFETLDLATGQHQEPSDCLGDRADD